MTAIETSAEKPWYRQFWFWLVMTPLIVVMPVSFTLVTVAVLHSDDRVIDNYYKHGRMINLSLEQDERAALWQVAAEIQISDSHLLVELQTRTQYPPALSLWLDHPFEADRDQFVILERQADGYYHGQLTVSAGDWHLNLTPEAARDERTEAPWRLRGELSLRPERDRYSFTLQARPRD